MQSDVDVVDSVNLISDTEASDYMQTNNTTTRPVPAGDSVPFVCLVRRPGCGR